MPLIKPQIFVAHILIDYIGINSLKTLKLIKEWTHLKQLHNGSKVTEFNIKKGVMYNIRRL